MAYPCAAFALVVHLRAKCLPQKKLKPSLIRWTWLNHTRLPLRVDAHARFFFFFWSPSTINLSHAWNKQELERKTETICALTINNVELNQIQWCTSELFDYINYSMNKDPPFAHYYICFNHPNYIRFDLSLFW